MSHRCRQAHRSEDLEPHDRHHLLIFDWDGTLADSHAVNYAALDQALRAYGAALDRGWYDAHTGTSAREAVAQVGAMLGVEFDVAAVTRARDAAYLERVAEVSEIEAVTSVVRRGRGIRQVALATGGGRRTVTATATALGLLGLFDAVVTRDDVARGKPAPDIFLAASGRLGVDPARCLVYEDSDEGLAAAAAAGMDSVDVRPLVGR